SFCMAHARRKFVEAEKYDQEAAQYVVGQMRVLYALESSMREAGLSSEARAKLRQEQAIPILETLGNWLNKNLYAYPPKSPMGEAIAYAHSRWAGLSFYTLHGDMEIDNNLVENAVRPLAVGRKNYLFAGSHDAAHMTAAMYSFMASCKRNGVDEREWLSDIFDRVQGIKHKDLFKLLPSNWAKYRGQL
ncbi:transposase IS66, partial [Nitritalea halalkaliphila LW7]